MKKSILSSVSVMAFVSAALQAAPMSETELFEAKQEYMTAALNNASCEIKAAVSASIQTQVTHALGSKKTLVAHTQENNNVVMTTTLGR